MMIRSIAATVVEMMTAEWPYKSDPRIKDKRTVVYLVGKNKLNPLQSASVERLINDESITQDAVTFLTECFKRSVYRLPLSTDVMMSLLQCCRGQTFSC